MASAKLRRRGCKHRLLTWRDSIDRTRQEGSRKNNGAAKANAQARREANGGEIISSISAIASAAAYKA